MTDKELHTEIERLRAELQETKRLYTLALCNNIELVETIDKFINSFDEMREAYREELERR